MHSHFEDEDPLAHVIEKKVNGILSLSESHGVEMPGHFSAAADAMRETALVILLLWMFLQFLAIDFSLSFLILSSFGCGWFAWKTGRSAWLGWARLERLHRVIEQEKYEIEHHRSQERVELKALYRAKGFEGKLLEDVLDVLMADQDRLLKVMLEEELGLTLQAYDHPLKQCLGAAVGTALSLLLLGLLFYFFPPYGIAITSFILLAAGATLSAIFEKNRVIPALIWTLGLGALAYGVTYFMLHLTL